MKNKKIIRGAVPLYLCAVLSFQEKMNGIVNQNGMI